MSKRDTFCWACLCPLIKVRSYKIADSSNFQGMKIADSSNFQDNARETTQCSSRNATSDGEIIKNMKHTTLCAYGEDGTNFSVTTEPANEFRCEECLISFQSRLRFEAHQMKQHSTDSLHKIFNCDINKCDRVYKNKSALNVHQRKVHNIGPELKQHMCERCGKVFKSSSVLKDHRYTHIDKAQLPFACDEDGCCKRFSNKEKLKIHMLRHAGIKKFICPHCGTRKTTHNELKIHINYHTLERTWPCNFCPKVCNSAGNLKMHVRNIHERVKDYPCCFCERTFAKADTRKYHEMTHTGEKNYACGECGRKFLQPAALRTHRKVHLKQQQQIEQPKGSVKRDTLDKSSNDFESGKEIQSSIREELQQLEKLSEE